MSKIFWKTIWGLSEYAGIGLGRFAPYVFSKMIGVMGNELRAEQRARIK